MTSEAKSTPAADLLAINTIRTLAMDAVQQADSGHPGTPMALAPVAYALWQRVLRFDPADPLWPDRDRFVLSNGHASMLLYGLLHLAGVRQCDGRTGADAGRPAITLEDIRNFRQLGSPCAGHPEHGLATGIETTTGPLGQGLATSVGMAIASRWLAARHNAPGREIFSYRVWAICGDGCLMEGISGEAASLAGHLGLSNLCWIYDNNHITIEGKTSLAYSDDVAGRFRAYGWDVQHVTDANDVEAVVAACEAARGASKPTMVIVDSHIGYGAPTRQDTAAAHGEPLGEEEIKGAKRFYGWPEDAKFLVPDGVRERFAAGIGARGAALSKAWRERMAAYEGKDAARASEVAMMARRELPQGWGDSLPTFAADAKGLATRASGGQVVQAIAKSVPWFLGGAADLAPSTKTLIGGEGPVAPGAPGGRNLHFGIREHAMAAACNGLALCGLRPFGASFFTFTDYARGAIRLSALMELPVVHVYTHDSIGLGEDGPTHQPIEHLASLRAMPGMQVMRPCDANETTECWRQAMLSAHGPTMMVLSRQNLPTLAETGTKAREGCARGAYILRECSCGVPHVLLLASGSEVSPCLEAQAALEKEGICARVVSVPCWERFDAQAQEYRDRVLPPAVVARVAVEAASPLGWERYAGSGGTILGMRTFGASAPWKVLQKHFGLDAASVAAAAREQVATHGIKVGKQQPCGACGG